MSIETWGERVNSSDERDPAIAADKAALRERYAEVRRNLPPERRASASAMACERVLEELTRYPAQTVSVYWPMISRGELDTRDLIHSLAGRGIRVVMPVITWRNPPTLSHVAFESEDALVETEWGIREPVGEIVPRKEIDLFVVPAIAAGRNLHRIGHGKGYYDRLLASSPGSSICVVYEECLIEHVPAEDHDTRLDVVVTDERRLAAPLA